MKKRLDVLCRAAVVGVSVMLLGGCGFVQVTTPADQEATSTSAKMAANPSTTATATPGSREALERELLGVRGQLPVHGEERNVEEAERVIALFRSKRGEPAGERVPGEVLILRVRSALSRAPLAMRGRVLDLWREARDLAPGVAAEEEGSDTERRDFAVLVAHLGELVTLAQGKSYPAIEAEAKRFDADYAGYVANAQHKTPSLRVKAVADEVRQIVENNREATKRFAEAQARLERDAQYRRLGDERQRLEREAGVLKGKLGIVDMTDGCAKTSADPIDRQRLAALCPKMTRVHAITAQMYAIEQRYMAAVWPEKKGLGGPR